MSWGRINHPSDMVRIDDKIEVMVLRVDKDREKAVRNSGPYTMVPFATLGSLTTFDRPV